MTAPLGDLRRNVAFAVLDLLQKKARESKMGLFDRMFPDEDDLDNLDQDGEILFHSRDKYKKHTEFFAAGATYRERCAMSANRVGKTLGMGGYELTCHVTGKYPHWWEGRRFKLPVKTWAAGKTRETTRDILQATLMGEMVKLDDGRKTFDGTGLLPATDIGAMSFRSGGSDLLDSVKVRHTSGGWSTIGFKSFEQGRGAFEGTAQHVILLDEEPPLDVYNECVIRTATTNGLIMLTFTPLEGLSETVLQFMPTEFYDED